MTDQRTPSGWKRFWEKGGWWRSLLLVVGYYALWQLLTVVLLPIITSVDPANKGLAVFVGTGLPVALGCVLLIAFALSTGWLQEVFARQSIGGSWWMWIAVVVTVLFNALHFAGIDYAKAGAGVVLGWVVSSLFVGFAEEFLTRGLVVNLMRKAGYREIVVAVVSAALFAALHAGNLLSGQPLLATGLQLLYTFGFGICMYLAMRVGGSIIWPILIHGTTDSSIFLMVGNPAPGMLASLANLGNPVVIITGLVLLIFIRGRVNARPASAATTPLV
ncbi:CPBP family intramembrane metalloprotease [Microbacterium sp. Au-Mic1]|uniref:CPBP family intramembrane glutamic endopeptidase n=1 Tax=Microbacterium sp. Au-Mic1 TaxID=2906457 RepID=UPI001E487EDA|nr:CPBP family intramembrane glutamic endopeptidase [Microbacterium sp. Au-Mic1]MCE4026110.1 CPBP family intramembrane metalloprotease [Microbacterium sp. Au-Mic1]